MEENNIKIEKKGNTIVAISILFVGIVCLALGIFIGKDYLSNNTTDNNGKITTTTSSVENVKVDEEKINYMITNAISYKFGEDYVVSELNNEEKLNLVSNFINYQETNTLELFNKKVNSLINENVEADNIKDGLCGENYYLYDNTKKVFSYNENHSGHGGLEEWYFYNILDTKVENNIVTVKVNKLLAAGIGYEEVYSDRNTKLFDWSDTVEGIELKTCSDFEENDPYAHNCISDDNIKQAFEVYKSKLKVFEYKFEVDSEGNYLLLSQEVK